MKHSPYLSGLLEDRRTHQECVQGILRALQPKDRDFEAIACTGVSGLLIGPTIAYLMNKRLAVIRKDNDKPGQNVNHAMTQVEHNLCDGDRVIVIDDLVASGSTMQAIGRALEGLNHATRLGEGYTQVPIKVHWKGWYVYRDHRYTEGGW